MDGGKALGEPGRETVKKLRCRPNLPNSTEKFTKKLQNIAETTDQQ